MGEGAIAGFNIRSGVKKWGRGRLKGSIYDQGLRSGEGEIAGFNIRSGVKEWGRGRLKGSIYDQGLRSGVGGVCRVQYTIRG